LSDCSNLFEVAVSGVNYFSQSTTTILPYQRQLLSGQNTADLLDWC